MEPTLYEEPYTMTLDRVVEIARQWRIAQGRGPVFQGRAAAEFRAQSVTLRNQAISSSIFAEDLIRETIAGVIRHETPEMKFANGKLISIVTSGNRGAQAFGWSELRRTGLDPATGIVSEMTDNIQSVTLEGAQRIQQIETHARRFDWTIQDLDTAAMQGAFDLISEKSSATKEQMSYDVDEYVAAGVAGIWPSLYAYPGALTLAATTGNWASASNAQIIADVSAAINYHRTQTNGTYSFDTVLTPMGLWERLNTPFGNEGARTLLEVLKSLHPQITLWDWERHLTTTVFFYNRSPNRIAVRMPVFQEALPPEPTAMRFSTILRSRFAGVYSTHPRSMLRLTGVA